MMTNEVSMNDNTQWFLEAIADEGKEWLVSIDAVPFIIGRNDDCHLKLIDKRISRHHSEIRKSLKLLWIRDLSSTNGTFVNQKKIEQAEVLDAEDKISIGQYKFKVTRVVASTQSTSLETIHATLSEEMADLPSIEPKLRQLIQERNVNPHFQPLVKFPDMSEIGYEILGRIGDPDLPSKPSELLDIADFLGCGCELSALFREVGVALGKNLPGHCVLFVNTTKLELCAMDALLDSLQRLHDITPSRKIVLEINEEAVADPATFSNLRDALNTLQMGLAFDDFGVGQTRLVDLSTISPDYLKFDMSLIRQIHLAPKRLHQMIATFIKAAHDLGTQTLAEGIECAEEAEVCRELGFDLGQGYLFGKPAPLGQIESDLMHSKSILNRLRAQNAAR